jgi:hypothetical protein
MGSVFEYIDGMISRVPVRPGMAGGAGASLEPAGHPVTRSGSGRTNRQRKNQRDDHRTSSGAGAPLQPCPRSSSAIASSSRADSSQLNAAAWATDAVELAAQAS